MEMHICRKQKRLHWLPRIPNVHIMDYVHTRTLEYLLNYPNEKYKGEQHIEKRILEAKVKVAKIVKDYKIDLIAIGNGTASRESEKLVTIFESKWYKALQELKNKEKTTS